MVMGDGAGNLDEGAGAHVMFTPCADECLRKRFRIRVEIHA